jgi:demethylmenaquinone methyltransferase/2-methoxy-6-polyprenyl-1,4-benzoquinol methylase
LRDFGLAVQLLQSASYVPLEPLLGTRARTAAGGVSPPQSTEEERAYYRFNKKAWSIFAPYYDFVTRPFRRLRDHVTDLAQIGPTMRVLDVATGTGEQALSFAMRAAEVVGVDLSDAMLDIARRKNQLPNITFQQADAVALPFPDESFDVACISFALHEMPRSIRHRALREMRRVVRPGGRIVVVDWGLPKRQFSSWLVSHLVRLFEGKTYVDFVHSDVEAFVAGAGVDLERHDAKLHGIAQVLVGRRR